MPDANAPQVVRCHDRRLDLSIRRVILKDASGLAAHSRAALAATTWLERLDNLESRLADNRIRDLVNLTASDGVDADTLRKNRDALLQRIQTAKKYFQERAGSGR